jgi:hypothetical protein
VKKVSLLEGVISRLALALVLLGSLITSVLANPGKCPNASGGCVCACNGDKCMWMPGNNKSKEWVEADDSSCTEAIVIISTPVIIANTPVDPVIISTPVIIVNTPVVVIDTPIVEIDIPVPGNTQVVELPGTPAPKLQTLPGLPTSPGCDDCLQKQREADALSTMAALQVTKWAYESR